MVAGKKARLQLADPVPALRQRQLPVAGETTLHPKLVKLGIVKATEMRRRAAERPNEPELRGDGVNGETESHLLRKRETTLGFALHLIERIAGSEKIRVQVGAAVRRKSEVTDLVRRLEPATQRIAASPDMFRPGRDDTSKVQMGPGLEARQPALFDQVIAEPAESESGLVVAEARSGEQAKHDISEARAVTVAALEAEIDRPTNDQGKQVRIRMPGRRPELGQDIKGRERCGIAHQGQIDELLDRAGSELGPDPLILAPRFVFRRVRRRVDAGMREIVEADGVRAAPLTEGRVRIRQRDLPAGGAVHDPRSR